MGIKMKFDMHCHTSEGSVDGHVTVAEYIAILKRNGFAGMLITDHDSYGGYEAYLKQELQRVEPDFLVFKGMEYDTFDYGHMLVIMPKHSPLDILEYRGLTVKKLIKIVHFYGGILGPAHPCGEPFLSFDSCKVWGKTKKERILRSFDFIEAFNACEPGKSNAAAEELSRKYELPGFGGSDAHKPECAGMGYTVFPDDIRDETGLIQYLKTRPRLAHGGERYRHTTKDKLGIWNKGLVYGFFLYNKLAACYRFPIRIRELCKLAAEIVQGSEENSYGNRGRIC